MYIPVMQRLDHYRTGFSWESFTCRTAKLSAQTGLFPAEAGLSASFRHT